MNLKPNSKPRVRILNIESSEEWSVIDLGDILIHLLTPEHRGIYNIEELLESLKKIKA